MTLKLNRWIRNLVPNRIKTFLTYSEELEYGTFCFSQRGEDMVIRNSFLTRENGFYVDIGAHHPIRYSNTYFFYMRGWSGICIDPLPGSRELFQKWRPRDNFLQVGVSSARGILDYFSFREPLENTFSKAKADKIDVTLNPLKEILKIEVIPLSEIFEKNLPAGKTIDLMSIDAEGYDLDILKSNNWTRWSPQCVLAEAIEMRQVKVEENEIFQFLSAKGYHLKAFGYSYLFFERGT